MGQHIMDQYRDVCIACGYARQEIEDRVVPMVCRAVPAYREYLLGSAWVRTPIIPNGVR